MALSLRLDQKTENSINRYAAENGCSKSQFIRNLISDFIDKDQSMTPWELGKDLFGRESSGDAMLSTNRKAVVKDKIYAKQNRN